MKKIYPFFFFVGSCFAVKAQYTLTSASNPVIGDVVKSWNLDTAGLVMGSAGANQTWNFTGLIISAGASVITNSYVTASSAPNSSLFPNATIASTGDGSIFGMFDYTNSNAVYYGFTSSTLTGVYGNPEIMYTLPFTYNSNCSDTYSTTYVTGGVTITTHGTVTITGDAYGTLNTPSHTYSNVLRLKYEDIQVDQMGALGTDTAKSVSYSYLNSSSKAALLSLNSTTFSSSTNTVVTYFKSGSISDNVLQGIKEQNGEASFSMYPNPAVNKEVVLNFSLLNSENYVVNIYNAVGQNVLEVNMGEKTPGSYKEKIDLGNLQSGIYFVKLKGRNLQGVQKLIIQ